MSLTDIVKSAGRKIGKGLATGAAFVAFSLPLNAEGGALTIYPDNLGVSNNPVVSVRHVTGATETLDPVYDSEFLPAPSPAIEFYSEVSFDPYKLNTDVRGPDSLSTFYTKIEGRGLSEPVDFQLNFGIWQPNGEDNFVGKDIQANLFDASYNPIGSYDVRALADGSETFPTLSVNNGLSYNLDIRFTENAPSSPVPEPSTGGLVGALIAAQALVGKRRTRRGTNPRAR